MHTQRLYSVSESREQVYLKKPAVVISALILVLCMSFLLGCNIADAHSSSQKDSADQGYHKYYKSVEIHYGDTLWGIAEKYMDGDRSINEYIDELKEINNLDTDDIQDSHYLTITYYNTDLQ